MFERELGFLYKWIRPLICLTISLTDSISLLGLFDSLRLYSLLGLHSLKFDFKSTQIRIWVSFLDKERTMYLPSGLPMPGITFVPTDQQLVSYYLQSKVKGEYCGDIIQDMDVYSRDPWLLPHKSHPLFSEQEWFYFVKLVQVSGKADGKMPKRKIDGDHSGNYWRTTVGDKAIYSATGQLLGYKKCLSFYTNKKQNGSNKAGLKSDWTMIEYSLGSHSQSFQNLVLCRIRHNVKRSHSSATSSSTQEQSSSIDSLVASSSTSPAESYISHCAPATPHLPYNVSGGMDFSGPTYESSSIEMEQTVPSQEENWHQGCAPMLTTEGAVPLEVADDETFMIEAPELRWLQDQSLGSDSLGYAPAISGVVSQSSFAYGVEAPAMDVVGLYDAESVQKDIYMEETPTADGYQFQELSSSLRADGSNHLEFTNDEVYLIESPNVPWMEDQRSLGVCAMDVTSYPDIAVESVHKDANVKETTAHEEENWLENLAAMMRAEDSMVQNAPWIADPSLCTLWC